LGKHPRIMQRSTTVRTCLGIAYAAFCEQLTKWPRTRAKQRKLLLRLGNMHRHWQPAVATKIDHPSQQVGRYGVRRMRTDSDMRELFFRLLELTDRLFQKIEPLNEAV